MRFQPILNTIFSKFSGGACPRTFLESLKNFFLAAPKLFLGSTLPPPKQKIVDRTLQMVDTNPIWSGLPINLPRAEMQHFPFMLGLVDTTHVLDPIIILLTLFLLIEILMRLTIFFIFFEFE